MTSQKSFTNHRCELKEKSTIRGLHRLAPNASRWTKFKRWLRTLSLLSETNSRSLEFFANASSMRQELYRHAKSRYTYVIHPFSKMSYSMDLLFFSFWGIQLCILPVYFALRLVEEDIPLTPFIAHSMFIAQAIPFISFFFTGYIIHKTKTIILEPKEICRHYLRTFFIPDLIALVGPFAYNIATLRNHDIEGIFDITILCCYLVRLPSIKMTMQHIFLAAGLSKNATFIIGHLCTMPIMLHLMTALVITIPIILYADDYPDDSWLKQAQTGIIAYYSEGLLITCCYFFGVASTSKITVPNEEITLFLVSLLGRLYTLYVIADILRLSGLGNVSESRYENIMSNMDKYVKSLNLPPHLRLKMKSYCRYKLQGEYFNERQILQTLSSHIRTEICLHFAKKLLVSIPVFRLMPKKEIGSLLADMQNVIYSPGDKIIQVGDEMEFIYFINSGAVALYEGDLELFHYEDGDTIGDGGVTRAECFGNKHRYSYLAIEYTDIYKVHRDRFRQLLAENDEVRRYFEFRGNEKAEKFGALRKELKYGNDIISELNNRKILEKPKLKRHYVP
ncbi:unnamed protein product [Callosobruchus maculatus]|uniref:Cyclic nucleotide-binding domain-containing protein n=1 Tax=Callosobruchus maculatus TaxID=64391 RepID=A0A653BTZ0_CALMS|nr:unnamed protein product [Callosobruchus maculatus]